MRPFHLTALALIAFAAPAIAQNGGDRTRAGGAFMSSYSESAPANTSRVAQARSLEVPVTGSIERRGAKHHR